MPAGGAGRGMGKGMPQKAASKGVAKKTGAPMVAKGRADMTGTASKGQQAMPTKTAAKKMPANPAGPGTGMKGAKKMGTNASGMKKGR